MGKTKITRILLTLLLACILFSALYEFSVKGWSNGGFSPDPEVPYYGTHDWIAEHALDRLPSYEKSYILSNLNLYLYGTELPDNGGAPDGIGDTARHHIYYYSNGTLQDDASAVRAQEEFNKALEYFRLGNQAMAAKTLGIMSHYIADMGVFGHVMGSGTDWGPETHHSDYESYVNTRTDNYWDEFNAYLAFDGDLSIISADYAALRLAYDTTFDVDGNLTCLWMDQSYNWNNAYFRNRCGESLNFAVNLLTDVLHTFYVFRNVIRVPEDYSTLQAAVNAANPGDQISIAVGVYNEYVVINKPLTIIGRKGSSPIFAGGGSGICITLLPDASGTTIVGIVITDYSQGIYIQDSNDNIIYNTTLNLNNLGLNVIGDRNIIYANTIVDNSVGVTTLTSEENLIYSNNFFDNTMQVDSSISANSWDNGYFIGGNYWSTHISADVYRGPDQNIPGSDGICDDPYIIDTNNRDNYPLVDPWVPPDNNIAIVDVALSKTIIGQGGIVTIRVQVANQGEFTHSVNVITQANGVTFDSIGMILSGSTLTEFVLFWDTSTFLKDNYTITVSASVVTGELYTTDNNVISGWIIVAMIGDITGPDGWPDGLCDMRDVGLVSRLFGKDHPDPMYDANYDVYYDLKIDMRDIAIIARHFGEIDP